MTRIDTMPMLNEVALRMTISWIVFSQNSPSYEVVQTHLASSSVHLQTPPFKQFILEHLISCDDCSQYLPSYLLRGHEHTPFVELVMLFKQKPPFIHGLSGHNLIWFILMLQKSPLYPSLQIHLSVDLSHMPLFEQLNMQYVFSIR